MNNIIDVWSISTLPVVLVAVAALAILVGPKREPSVIFLHLILLTLVTPSLVLLVSGGLPWMFAATTSISFVIVTILPKFVSINLKWGGIFSSYGMLVFCTLGVVAYTVSIIGFGGFEYINFNILKVYDVRDLIISSIPSAFGYLTPIATGIFIPIAAVEATRRRAWGLVLFLVGLGLFLFGVTSYKGIALNAVASIAFYWLSSQKRPVESIVGFLILGLIASTLETELAHFTQNMMGYDSGIFSSLFLRRFLLVPSIINWAYMDYFDHIEKFYWWSTSRITLGLVSNPFGVLPPLLIGTEYFKDPTLWANGGWIASGFANASYLGILVYSIGFGIVLSAMDTLGRKLGMPFVVGSMTLIVWKIATTTDFLTAMLTHGLLLALLLLILVRDDGPAQHSVSMSKKA
ncbi:MAG: hypothetical protein ACTHNH_16300 [Mesorhizobium sp.]